MHNGLHAYHLTLKSSLLFVCGIVYIVYYGYYYYKKAKTQ